MDIDEWAKQIEKIGMLMFELGADMEYHGGFGTHGDTGRLLVLVSRDIKLLAEYMRASCCDSDESI